MDEYYRKIIVSSMKPGIDIFWDVRTVVGIVLRAGRIILSLYLEGKVRSREKASGLSG